MIIFGKLKDRIDLSDARIVFVFPWVGGAGAEGRVDSSNSIRALKLTC